MRVSRRASDCSESCSGTYGVGARSGGCGQRRLEVPGQEFVEAVVGMTVRQAIENRGEIGLRIKPAQLGAFEDGVDGGRSVATTVGTKKQKILARDCNSAHQPLGRVVVDAEATVLDIPGQRI